MPLCQLLASSLQSALLARDIQPTNSHTQSTELISAQDNWHCARQFVDAQESWQCARPFVDAQFLRGPWLASFTAARASVGRWRGVRVGLQSGRRARHRRGRGGGAAAATALAAARLRCEPVLETDEMSRHGQLRRGRVRMRAWTARWLTCTLGSTA
eukprot:6192283-Pleurochrysis_carterae.AAC.2